MGRINKFDSGFGRVGSVGFGPALAALKLQKSLAFTGAAGAIFLFFAVMTDNHFLLSISAANDMHGLTAISLLLLALAGISRRKFRNTSYFRDAAFAVIALLAALRLGEAIVSPNLSFSSGIDAALGRISEQLTPMGLNTAASLLLLSGGAFMRHRASTLSILMILTGLVLPSVSALEFSYNHQGRYGQMCLATTVLLLTLGGAELLLFARSPLLRPFLTTSSWGRMARLQLLVVVCGAWFLGALVEHSHGHVHGDVEVLSEGIEIVVVGVIWLFLVTMLITGPQFERVDRDRRALERELSRKANIDPLTGLWNRRAVREMQFFDAKDEDGRASGTDHIGVIMADVDMFKRINDIAGHDEGDKVLRNISRVLRERVRGLDVVARWGGEEFVILLPDLTQEKAMEVAQGLCAAVATSVKWSNKGQLEPVTLSIGVTSLKNNAHKALDVALQDADNALYTAKSLGRNRAILFGDVPQAVKPDAANDTLLKCSLH